MLTYYLGGVGSFLSESLSLFLSYLPPLGYRSIMRSEWIDKKIMDKYREQSQGKWYLYKYFINSYLENRNARNASKHK